LAKYSEGPCQTWRKRICNKSVSIGVVGLGYVGLPLAVAFSEAGFRVLGFDIKRERVESINQGKSYIADLSSRRLQNVVASSLLRASIDQSELKEMEAICICVPTPLTKTKAPDLSYVIYESKEISRYLHPGQLIVLESTSYPGTTVQVVLPILESSKYKGGEDFYLAYSPERVDPGNKKYNIKNTPKIVGGITTESTEICKLLYSKIADSVITVSSPAVAEMAKVFENVFRSVNIALINELAQLCQCMGISVWEVIQSASTKPYGYMPFYPGPGVGGHCIPIDPYYLADKARELDFHTRFIELAAEINEGMPYYVVSRIMDALNAMGKSLNAAKLLVLGVSYKKDVDEIGGSPSLKIIELLREKGGHISYSDPYVSKIQLSRDVFTSVELTKEALSSVDCVIIATDHSCYDIKKIVSYSKLLFDTRGVTSRLRNHNIIRLGE
jgi:UDP-N-acetyl-D-glucosamine dehydrogenase